MPLSVYDRLTEIYSRMRQKWSLGGRLSKVLESHESIVDVGCGRKSVLSEIHDSSTVSCSVGVDIHRPYLVEAKSASIHDYYVQLDLNQELQCIKNNSVDIALAVDVIEHLDKEKAYELLSAMEAVASKQVVVVTPNGFINQRQYEDNPYQRHRSGWGYEELEALGYSVSGVNGIKWLRGEQGRVMLSPKSVGVIVSDLSQIVVNIVGPELAYQLVAVKTL